jgi:SAM-dependent methyltransferase
MKSQEIISSATRPAKSLRRVLNAGSGAYAAHRLHPVFARDAWQEIRIDIDPQAKPDFVSSITDLRSSFQSQTIDAVWSSHTLEHLYAHEVPLALAEFRRVLRPDGFALITSPDLEAVASIIVDRGLDHIAYTSPAGPISPLDMLFGHSSSIAAGHVHMAHKTGFTCASLGRRFVDAGFPIVLVKQDGLNLWALGLMQAADQNQVQKQLLAVGLDLSEAN